MVQCMVFHYMRYKILILMMFGFCYAQDSTAINLKIEEQVKLRNTIQEQVMRGQLDLQKIDYAIFVLEEMLKPPKEEEKDEKDIN